MKKGKVKINNSFLTGRVFMIVVLITCILFLIIVTNSGNKKEITETETPVSNNDPFQIYVTPTLIPTANNKLMTFIHPQNHFSFEYPSDWKVILTKKEFSDHDQYSVMLTDQSGHYDFKMHFMNQGRGGPYYEYETNEEKIINGRRINLNTVYKDNKAFESVVSFPDNDFGNNLIGLYIYLPQENQEEFITQVEEIIASLE